MYQKFFNASEIETWSREAGIGLIKKTAYSKIIQTGFLEKDNSLLWSAYGMQNENIMQKCEK